MSDYVVALSTVATPEDAERIAQALVERRLAACVNVVPGITSVYRWQGAVSRDSECLLLIKTRRDKIAALKDDLAGLHPYEVPELVLLPSEVGLASYGAWIDDCLEG